MPLKLNPLDFTIWFCRMLDQNRSCLVLQLENNPNLDGLESIEIKLVTKVPIDQEDIEEDDWKVEHLTNHDFYRPPILKSFNKLLQRY